MRISDKLQGDAYAVIHILKITAFHLPDLDREGEIQEDGGWGKE